MSATRRRERAQPQRRRAQAAHRGVRRGERAVNRLALCQIGIVGRIEDAGAVAAQQALQITHVYVVGHHGCWKPTAGRRLRFVQAQGRRRGRFAAPGAAATGRPRARRACLCGRSEAGVRGCGGDFWRHSARLWLWAEGFADCQEKRESLAFATRPPPSSKGRLGLGREHTHTHSTWRRRGGWWGRESFSGTPREQGRGLHDARVG